MLQQVGYSQNCLPCLGRTQPEAKVTSAPAQVSVQPPPQEQANYQPAPAPKAATHLNFLETLSPHPEAPVKNFYINGIRTESEQAEYQACRLGEHLGAEVELIYNPTEGLLADGWEAFQNLAGFQTDIALRAKDQFKQALDQGQRLRLFSHSQGAAITADALRRLEKDYFKAGFSPERVAEKMAQIEVVGFGGFATKEDYPHGVKVSLFNKIDDPIPQFAREYNGLKKSLGELGQAFESEEKDLFNKFGATVMSLGSTTYTLGNFVFRNFQQAVGAAAGKTVNILNNQGLEGLGKIDWNDFCRSVSTTVQSDHLAVVKEDYTRTFVTPGYIDEFKEKYASTGQSGQNIG